MTSSTQITLKTKDWHSPFLPLLCSLPLHDLSDLLLPDLLLHALLLPRHLLQQKGQGRGRHRISGSVFSFQRALVDCSYQLSTDWRANVKGHEWRGAYNQSFPIESNAKSSCIKELSKSERKVQSVIIIIYMCTIYLVGCFLISLQWKDEPDTRQKWLKSTCALQQQNNQQQCWFSVPCLFLNILLLLFPLKQRIASCLNAGSQQLWAFPK